MKPIFHLLRELPLLAAECSLHMLGMIPKSTPSLPALLPFRSCIHWDVGRGSGSEQDTLGCFLCAVRWREQPVRENTKWCWSGTEKACFSVGVSQFMDPGPPDGQRELSGHSTQQKGLLLCQTCLRAHFALGAPSCPSQWDEEEEDDVLMERRKRICPFLRTHWNGTENRGGIGDLQGLGI